MTFLVALCIASDYPQSTKETNEGVHMRRVDPVATWHSLTANYHSNLYRINNLKKIFSRLQDAFELLFEDFKSLPDVFEVPATRENDLS